jgi:hypothetical protein
MADLDDHDSCRGVIDCVQNAVVTLSEAVPVLAGQFLGTAGPWVSAEALELGSSALAVLFRQRFEFFRG